MRILREWLQRLRGSLGAGRADVDLEQELRFHLEMAADDARRRGMNSGDARRAARLGAGGPSQAFDALRDQRGVPWLDDFARDVRHGLRSLRRTPLFTAVALVTLALGIGANTAIFSLVSSVLLAPLAYPNPARLMILTPDAAQGGSLTTLSYPEYEEFREVNQSFAQVGAFTIGSTNTGGGGGSWAGEVNLTAGDRPLRVRSAGVDHHLLGVLGVRPLHGRFFAPGETDAMSARPGLGGPPLAILSYELWQTAFGGEPVVGQTVHVDGRPHDVIGIMPPGVDLMDAQPEIWLPLGVHPVIRRIRTSHLLTVVGRLKEGAAPEAARAELNALLEDWGERTGATGHLPTREPSRARDHALRLEPLRTAIVGGASRVIWVLQAAVALVLLIACANLANLVTARAESRRREFAVRAALGAGRGRLFRQTGTEGLLLSFAGGALGLWLAHLGVRALVLSYPDSLPRTGDVAVDVRVLLFALGLSMGAGLLFGLAPVARAQTRNLVVASRESGRGGGRHGVRGALVTAEVALAVMLVLVAGLLLRTMYNLTHADPGFDRSQLMTFSITLPRATSYEGGRAQVYVRLLAGLREAPGVQAATAMSDLPLSRFVQGYATSVGNEPPADGGTIETVEYYQFVMAGYFETMGIPIVAGRGFQPSDTISLERVALVNETLADRLWPGRDPVGQRLQPNLRASMGTSTNPWHTVIGVAKDVREGGVDRPAGSELYLFAEQPAPRLDGTHGPWQASAPPTMHVVLRTGLPPAALSQAIEHAVREVDPAVPVVRLRDMESVFAQSVRRPRLLAQLLGAFAALALLLAATGTYGVLAYLTTERRREIGIRMALGAARSSVIAHFMRRGLRFALPGVALGLAGALGLSRLLAAFLFGVQPTDPATIATVVLTISLVAAAASWLPAWRASRLDPLAVLRAE